MADYDPYSQMNRIMRMQNIFNPQAPTMGIPEQPMAAQAMGNQVPNQMVNEPYDVNARLAALYTPRTQMTDMYNQNMMGMPQRTNPNLMQKVLGVMAGLGSGSGPVGISGGQPIGFQGNPAAAMKGYDLVANAPYHNQMADWSAKSEQLRPAAYLENQNNVNERILAEQTIARELTQQRQDNQDDYNRGRLKIQEERAAVYRWRTENPQGKLVLPKGGFVHIVNPITNETTMLKDEAGKPIPTGSLSDEDRLQLTQANSLERLATGQNNALERLAQGQENALARIDANNTNRVSNDWSDPFEMTMADGSKKYVQVNNASGETRDVKVPGTLKRVSTDRVPNTPDETSPAQEKNARYNRAKEMSVRYPGYVKFPNNSATVYNVEKGWTGDQKIVDEINEYILSGKKPATPTSGPVPNSNAPANYKKQRSPSTGKYRESFDGGKTWREVK